MWTGVDSNFCTSVLVFVAVVFNFGLYFLVSSYFRVSLSVITGAVGCGGVCAVVVIFVGVIGLYFIVLLSVIVGVGVDLVLVIAVCGSVSTAADGVMLASVSSILVVFGGLLSLVYLSLWASSRCIILHGWKKADVCCW